MILVWMPFLAGEMNTNQEEFVVKIQEYLAKGLFASHGICVPSSAYHPGQPEKKSSFLPCFLKSQMLVKSRMKNAGVLYAANIDEFRKPKRDVAEAMDFIIDERD